MAHPKTTVVALHVEDESSNGFETAVSASGSNETSTPTTTTTATTTTATTTMVTVATAKTDDFKTHSHNTDGHETDGHKDGDMETEVFDRTTEIGDDCHSIGKQEEGHREGAAIGREVSGENIGNDRVVYNGTAAAAADSTAAENSITFDAENECPVESSSDDNLDAVGGSSSAGGSDGDGDFVFVGSGETGDVEQDQGEKTTQQQDNDRHVIGDNSSCEAPSTAAVEAAAAIATTPLRVDSPLRVAASDERGTTMERADDLGQSEHSLVSNMAAEDNGNKKNEDDDSTIITNTTANNNEQRMAFAIAPLVDENGKYDDDGSSESDLYTDDDENSPLQSSLEFIMPLVGEPATPSSRSGGSGGNWGLGSKCKKSRSHRSSGDLLCLVAGEEAWKDSRSGGGAGDDCRVPTVTSKGTEGANCDKGDRIFRSAVVSEIAPPFPLSDGTGSENVFENQQRSTTGSSPSVVSLENWVVPENGPDSNQNVAEDTAVHSGAHYNPGSCRESGKGEQPRRPCTVLDNTASAVLDTPEGAVPEKSPVVRNLVSRNEAENALDPCPAPLATIAAASGGSGSFTRLSKSATDILLQLTGGGDGLDDGGYGEPFDAENDPENRLGLYPTNLDAAAGCDGDGDENCQGLSRSATDILLQLSGVGEVDDREQADPPNAGFRIPRDVVVNAEARAERVVMAAQAGDSLTIQAFLAAGGDVETRDSRMGMTLLAWASRRGHVETIELLIGKGAAVMAGDGRMRTPLHRACSGCFSDVAKMLLENGADPNARDLTRRTPLHRAARWGSPACALLLLDAGADIEARDEELARTPLHFACRSGGVATTLLLLQNGADFNAKTVNGNTPLHLSCDRGLMMNVKALLEWGADPTVTNEAGTAPAEVAAPWVEDSVKAELKKLLTEASAVKNDQAAAVRPKPTIIRPRPPGASEAEVGLIEAIRSGRAGGGKDFSYHPECPSSCSTTTALGTHSNQGTLSGSSHGFLKAGAASAAHRCRSTPGEGGLPGGERWSMEPPFGAERTRSRKGLGRDRKMAFEEVSRSRGHHQEHQGGHCCVVQ